jgi:hypothetical protein
MPMVLHFCRFLLTPQDWTFNVIYSYIRALQSWKSWHAYNKLPYAVMFREIVFPYEKGFLVSYRHYFVGGELEFRTVDG